MPESWIPAACTLPSPQQPFRLAEFDELFATAVRAAYQLEESRGRLELDPEPALAARAADLAVRETDCCSFFTFTLTAGGGQLLLDVRVPPAHADVLAALVARAAAAVAP